jgi:hypothetical protein
LVCFFVLVAMGPRCSPSSEPVNVTVHHPQPPATPAKGMVKHT